MDIDWESSSAYLIISNEETRYPVYEYAYLYNNILDVAKKRMPSYTAPPATVIKSIDPKRPCRAPMTEEEVMKLSRQQLMRDVMKFNTKKDYLLWARNCHPDKMNKDVDEWFVSRIFGIASAYNW